LIDTSSIHNFLDAAMTTVLQLALDSILRFEVKVTNGDTIKTYDVCSDVKFTMQGHFFLSWFECITLR